VKDDFHSLIDYYERQRDSFVPYEFEDINKKNTKKKKRKKAHTIIKDDKKNIDAQTIEIINNFDSKIKVPVQPGFDISAFEKILQQELISEYKKYQSFSHPNITFGECTSCIRQQYYKRKKYPLDLNRLFSFSYLFFIKEVNEFLLELVQSVYKFEEVNKIIESKKFNVKGNVHAIDKKTGHLYYFSVIEPENLKEDTKKSHFNIANVQTHILNNEYDYRISNIVLIYLFRNLKKIEKYNAKPDENVSSIFLQNAILLKTALTNNAVPDKIGFTEKECRYCMFKSFCEKEDANKNNDIVMIF